MEMSEYLITLKLGEERVDVTTSTPFVVMLRDLFYEGDWTLMKEDLKRKEELIKEVEKCEKLEKIVRLDETVYDPIVFSELKEWMKEEGISVEDFNHVSLNGLYDLALEYADKNSYETAYDVIKFMLEIDRNYAPAYELMGSLLIEEGKVEEGIRYLDRAIEIDPWLVQAYASLGEAYYNLGEFDKAIQYWERELEYSPDDKLTYFMLAETYRKVNRKDLAIDVLERLLKRDPSNIVASYQLSQLYRESGNEEKAVFYERKILELTPRYPSEIEIWARVHFKYGEYGRAREVLERIAESSPVNVGLRLLLVIPYVKLGMLDHAREILEDFKQRNVWYYYGKKELFEEFLSEEERRVCGIS